MNPPDLRARRSRMASNRALATSTSFVMSAHAIATSPSHYDERRFLLIHPAMPLAVMVKIAICAFGGAPICAAPGLIFANRLLSKTRIFRGDITPEGDDTARGRTATLPPSVSIYSKRALENKDIVRSYTETPTQSRFFDPERVAAYRATRCWSSISLTLNIGSNGSSTVVLRVRWRTCSAAQDAKLIGSHVLLFCRLVRLVLHTRAYWLTSDRPRRHPKQGICCQGRVCDPARPLTAAPGFCASSARRQLARRRPLRPPPLRPLRHQCAQAVKTRMTTASEHGEIKSSLPVNFCAAPPV